MKKDLLVKFLTKTIAFVLFIFYGLGVSETNARTATQSEVDKAAIDFIKEKQAEAKKVKPLPVPGSKATKRKPLPAPGSKAKKLRPLPEPGSKASPTIRKGQKTTLQDELKGAKKPLKKPTKRARPSEKVGAEKTMVNALKKRRKKMGY